MGNCIPDQQRKVIYMSKRKIIISIGCVLAILFALGVYVITSNKENEKLSGEEINKYLKEMSLPLQVLSASYIVDMDNQEELIGLVDYVFVAEVVGINENTVYGEREEDVKTVYNVKVLQCVKGELEINSEVE